MYVYNLLKPRAEERRRRSDLPSHYLLIAVVQMSSSSSSMRMRCQTKDWNFDGRSPLLLRRQNTSDAAEISGESGAHGRYDLIMIGAGQGPLAAASATHPYHSDEAIGSIMNCLQMSSGHRVLCGSGVEYKVFDRAVTITITNDRNYNYLTKILHNQDEQLLFFSN